MDLDKLDKIVEYEQEIERLKKEKKAEILERQPAYVFEFTNIGCDTLATKALQEKVDRLIEEYGEYYKKDRRLYNRIEWSSKRITELTDTVKELDNINKTLEHKAVIYRDNNESIGDRIVTFLRRFEMAGIIIMLVWLIYLTFS